MKIEMRMKKYMPLNYESILEFCNYYVGIGRKVVIEDLNDYLSIEEWGTEEYEKNLVLGKDLEDFIAEINALSYETPLLVPDIKICDN